MANITDIVNSIIRYLGKVSITCNGRWKDNVDYDRLCVVYDDFASYISKQKYLLVLNLLILLIGKYFLIFKMRLKLIMKLLKLKFSIVLLI